jgi:glycosyltransferase involved in cell wall biosynthesis
MKILHVVPSYLPATRYGGPILSIHGLGAESAQQGHEVHVYTTNVNGDGDSDVPVGSPVNMDGIEVSYFPSKRLRRLYYSPPMQDALSVSVKDFDILHLHSIFLWPTWMAARCARANDKPYVLAPRGMLVKDLVRRRGQLRKTAWIRLIERRNLEHADAVHATSETESTEISRFGFALRRLVIVPNGYTGPPSGEASPRSAGGDRLRVLYLGRISWKKGLDRLLEAMALVPDAELLLAGNDDEQYRAELESLVAKLGLNGRIRFLGFVGDSEKSALLESVDLLVLPSYSENFGNAVLEAMAHACPVVVTPEVGISASVENAGAGLVVPGQPETLADAIARLCRDRTLRMSMGEAGKRVTEREFGWPRVATKMISVYQEILENRANG